MKRKVIITGLCLILAFSLTACGGSTKEASSTEIGTEAGSTVASANNEEQSNQSENLEEIEIVEETGTTEVLEDGSIVVITESGEEIVVSENTQKVENRDGSITYTQENGTTITISSTGNATVTTEKPVQGNSSSSTSNAGQNNASSSAGGDSSSSTSAKEESSSSESSSEESKTCSHTSSDWVVTKEATETAEGTKVKTCTTCGATLETASIAKVEHTCNYQWETNGNTRTLKCSCGATGITEECVAGVWGYFDRGAAESLYNYVNGQRAATTYEVQDDDGHTIDIATVPALTNFDGLYATAKQRAAEIATNYGHAGLKTDNENLGGGAANAQECYEAWCYSTSSHLSTMTNQIYTQGSCAVFWHDVDGTGKNLYPYYVLVVNK